MQLSYRTILSPYSSYKFMNVIWRLKPWLPTKILWSINNPQTQIPFGLHQNHEKFLLIEETPPHLSKHSKFSISPRNLHSCAFGTACSDWLSIIGQDLPGRRLMSRQWGTYIPVHIYHIQSSGTDVYTSWQTILSIHY